MRVSLADEIIETNVYNVRAILQAGIDVNQLDEYGFTYLVEAAIADNVEIAQLLIEYGANVNLQDSTGGTALQWAAENNNLALCQLLLEQGANPNAYNFSGQPVLVMPLLRHQTALRRLLVRYGADLAFARDFINTKLLGHMFELVGTADIITPDNQFIELDFEGFFLEFSVSVIYDSLSQFLNHFAARKLRRFHPIIDIIVKTLGRSAQLIQYQQYRTDLNKQNAKIEALIREEPLIMPIGYEGHAITFIKLGHIFAKCDRREDGRLYDNIMLYQVNRPAAFTMDFIKQIIYDKKSDYFVNDELPAWLDLEPITELKIEAQVSGNCSWANVEATLPTLFFLLTMGSAPAEADPAAYKSQALNFFDQWRNWNKDRALRFCLRSFQEEDTVRNLCKAEILAAILFQRCNGQNFADQERIELILDVLTQPPYRHVLDNYIRTYTYESFGQEGKDFALLLKRYGYEYTRQK
jgi:hypothetical protein